jgi:hypothetical protein
MRPGSAAKPESQIDKTAIDVAAILHPLLVESLYPRTFTGNIALSVHFQDGNVCHIKALDSDEQEPGKLVSTFVSSKDAADGGAGQVGNVLESAIRDLRVKMGTIAPGFFGVVCLTIEIEAGICSRVIWARERVHRKVTGGR